MKKVTSILLSLVMVIALCAMSVSAYAAVVSPEKPTNPRSNITVQVNGNETSDVVYERDPQDPTKITFTYTGDGELTGWEFPGMVEGEDYIIISQDGNSITIQLINDYDGDVVANAIVKEKKGETTTSQQPKPNGNNKSPKTGAATATAVAVAGAGIAVLAALKKRND